GQGVLALGGPDGGRHNEDDDQGEDHLEEDDRDYQATEAAPGLLTPGGEEGQGEGSEHEREQNEFAQDETPEFWLRSWRGRAPRSGPEYHGRGFGPGSPPRSWYY